MKRSMMMVALAGVLCILSMPAFAAFDNPDYTYTKILDVAVNVRTAESQFSPDGTKILWTERAVDFDLVPAKNVSYAVKYADWNPVTRTMSNVVTMDSSYDALGNPVYISGAKWSPDGTKVAYMKRDSTWGAAQIWRYNTGDASKAAYYLPATGKDCHNADFYGNSDSMIFWDITTGGADLFTYNGTTVTQVTNTSTRKEYEPRVFGTDTSKVLYWSGETTGEPYDSIHILNSDNSITDVALGSDGHELGWPVWGENQDYVGVVDLGSSWATELLLYKNVDGVWTLAEDLTGPGYTPAASANNFFGSFLADGSFCFQSQVGASGRDIWFAEIPEPATMALLALGGIGMLLSRRRNK